MPGEAQQQGLKAQLEVLGYCLSQVQRPLGTEGEEGQDVWEGRVERVKTPAVGVRRKANTDWHSMNC